MWLGLLIGGPLAYPCSVYDGWVARIGQGIDAIGLVIGVVLCIGINDQPSPTGPAEDYGCPAGPRTC